jgi:MoxR-like ATPase
MLVEVMAHVLAQDLGLRKPLPIFTLSGSSAITDHDLFGQYRPTIINGEEQLVWMEGIVSLACRVGGILYLDEINAMPGNVTAALHSVLDDRRQFVNVRRPVLDSHGHHVPEVVPVSPNLWCVCTYNPGYAGMSKTNEAFSNRFQWLEWSYDEKVEKRLIRYASIRVLALALRNARDLRSITTPVGTSAFQRFEADIAGFGVSFAVWAFLGQFNSPAERAKVGAILEERSILEMLHAELAAEGRPI